jgi:ribosome-associated protein
VVVLDLRGLTDASDFFVIASGTSDTQVRGIAENVIEQVERSGGGSPWHIEGLAVGRWVLLDYIEFVVHVFHHEVRAYYQLERLWGDAPTVEFPQVPAARIEGGPAAGDASPGAGPPDLGRAG